MPSAAPWRRHAEEERVAQRAHDVGLARLGPQCIAGEQLRRAELELAFDHECVLADRVIVQRNLRACGGGVRPDRLRRQARDVGKRATSVPDRAGTWYAITDAEHPTRAFARTW